MSDQYSINHFLEEVKGSLEAPADVESAISEGIGNLKGKISEVEVKLPEKKKADPVAKTEVKDKVGLADRAISTYKTKIAPPKGAEAGELETAMPSTIASRESMKATLRALTGQRSSGDVGKNSPTLPSGSGNVGTNDQPQVGLMPTTMTIEDYKHEIWSSFGLETEELAEEEVIETEELEEEIDVVAILEDALLQLEERDWMEVDRITRIVSEEVGVGVKQLNKAFKEEHGSYPDKWIKEQVETSQCGWMPIDEAVRVNKVGLVYEVSFIYRGKTMRYKFFWPSPSRPTREEIQNAIEGFYPKARVLAYYPAVKQDENFMVIVPPVTEHFEVLHWDHWEELSEELNETFHIIAEEVGEPVSCIVDSEDGYVVTVEDHDTGEHYNVIFQEGDEMKGLSVKGGHKRSTKSGAGLTQKGVDAVNRKTGGNLKTAVTTPPSKLDPDSKPAKRRKSFCARSRGWTGERGKAARRRWNC